MSFHMTSHALWRTLLMLHTSPIYTWCDTVPPKCLLCDCASQPLVSLQIWWCFAMNISEHPCKRHIDIGNQPWVYHIIFADFVWTHYLQSFSSQAIFRMKGHCENNLWSYLFPIGRYCMHNLTVAMWIAGSEPHASLIQTKCCTVQSLTKGMGRVMVVVVVLEKVAPICCHSS